MYLPLTIATEGRDNRYELSFLGSLVKVTQSSGRYQCRVRTELELDSIPYENGLQNIQLLNLTTGIQTFFVNLAVLSVTIGNANLMANSLTVRTNDTTSIRPHILTTPQTQFVGHGGQVYTGYSEITDPFACTTIVSSADVALPRELTDLALLQQTTPDGLLYMLSALLNHNPQIQFAACVVGQPWKNE